MVKIYGANIYSEHVQLALNHAEIQEFITGRYVLETGYDDENDPQLLCRVELNMGVASNQKITGLIQKIFIEEVRRVNSEYDYVLHNVGEKVKPKIILHKHGHPQYFPKGKLKKTA